MDQELGAAGGLDGRGAGRGVAGDDDGPARPRLPHHVGRADRPVGAGHGLATLEGGEVGAFGDPEPLRLLGVEAAGPLELDQRVAAGANAVLDRKRLDLAAIDVDPVPGLDLDQVEREAEAADEPAEGPEEVLEAGRAVDRQRLVAVGEVVGFEQAREAEEVIGVEVGQVDLVELDEAERALHLALGPLAAVEQEPFSSP